MSKQIFLMYPEMEFYLKVGDRSFLAHAEAEAEQYAKENNLSVEKVYRASKSKAKTEVTNATTE